MIHFDSYNVKYKSPQGAARCGSPVHFLLETSHEISYVNLVVREGDVSRAVKLMPSAYGVFEGDFTFENKGIYYYRFELVRENGTMLFAGTTDGHTADIGDWLSEWRIAAYDKDFYTARDTAGAVMYQIFPDRFYKADGVETASAANERIIHQNWNERPHCFYDYEGFKCNDFFMGNLKGIEQKLEYISSLGVTHIYLNPIFESAENHRYSTSDYTKVDPYLGNIEHFTQLCEKAKEYDIKIILDGVFSHTGDDSIYFNKYRHYEGDGAYNSKASQYYDWYNFKNYPDDYECWWGFETLPNVRETQPSYMEYITGDNGILRRWLRLGASGWRLDVADELPDEFLEAVRKAVKAEDPDALIIGEVWENAVTKESYGKQREFLLGTQCDSVMNYPFLNAVTGFVITGDSNEFYNSVMQILSDYPAPAVDCLMNVLSTHDTTRVLCRLGADTVPERRYQADARLTPQQRALGIERLLTAAVIQFTLPGIPCIFYGDEAGVEGFGDPSCRATFPWGREEQVLLDIHKKLGKIRKDNKTAFSKPMVFERFDSGVISYTRGDISVTVNKSDTPVLLKDGELLLSLKVSDNMILSGGAAIQRR